MFYFFRSYLSYVFSQNVCLKDITSFGVSESRQHFNVRNSCTLNFSEANENAFDAISDFQSRHNACIIFLIFRINSKYNKNFWTRPSIFQFLYFSVIIKQNFFHYKLKVLIFLQLNWGGKKSKKILKMFYFQENFPLGVSKD